MIFQEELMKSLLCNGDATAIECRERRVSYAELAGIVQTITHFLLREGLEKQSLVGIYLEDRIQLICAITGIINAGCVAVPIDPHFPAARQAAILENLSLQQLITGRDVPSPDAGVDLSGLKKYAIEDILSPAAAGYGGDVPSPKLEEDDSVYIYFTSGSTGSPKGIVGRNGSLLKFLQWEIDTFQVKETTRFSQFVSPYFDAFLRDIYVPLLAGGTICIPPEEDDLFTSARMIAWIDSQRIGLIHCVPSVFRIYNTGELSAALFPSLQYILLSGERVAPAELAGWYGVFGDRIELVNLYGPTEATMIRSYYFIRPEDTQRARIPIGKPMRGSAFLILRKDGKPCNVLEAGDLYIVSDQLTKGYLNAPELTHARFVRLKTGPSAEAIAFRTGDIARWLADGNTDLIGREDRQVKINGIRIEPEEIENVILRSGLVKEALVMRRVVAAQDMLVAFVTGREQSAGQPLEDLLRLHLQGHLPGYMVPSKIRVVAEFPFLTSGKVDHKALEDLLTDADVVVAPANATEERLLAIWKHILGDVPLSVNGNFYEAGGNSLAVMRLIAKIYKEFSVRISLGELFNNLTIRGQAELIHRAGRDNLFVLSKAPEKHGYPLSMAQERIYYHYELNKDSRAFNLPMAWEISNEIEQEKIEAILNTLIGRHESLRTSIEFKNGQLVQVVHPAVQLSAENIVAEDAGVQDRVLRFVRPFNLAKAPLIRCGIIHRAGGNRILVLDMHHIICDGISQGQLIAEFLQLYNGQPLPALSLHYKDYAQWERDFRNTDEYIAHREFWLKSFEGASPQMDFPVILQEDEADPEAGGNVLFHVDGTVTRGLRQLLVEEEVTVFAGLFAIYYLFLSQLTGQEEIVIGINSSGRIQEEMQEVIGMFAKTLPIRYRVDLHQTFRKLVKEIHGRLIEAGSRQIYDLADIVTELNLKRNTSIGDLFQVMLVFQNFGKADQPFPGLFARVELENNTSKYPLSLFVNEEGDDWYFRLEYSSRYFLQPDIEVLVGQLVSMIRQIAAHPEALLLDHITRSPMSPELEGEEIQFNF